MDWLELLTIKNHTVIVLMGLSRADEIARGATAVGVAANTPVAIVERASTPYQRTLITTLSELPTKAKKASSPAVIIIGDVVKLSNTLPHYIHETIKKEVEVGLAC